MTITDAIKTIEKYTGLDGEFFTSMDALLPVWNRLGLSYFTCDMSHSNGRTSVVFYKHGKYRSAITFGETTQEALCIATAELIRERV